MKRDTDRRDCVVTTPNGDAGGDKAGGNRAAPPDHRIAGCYGKRKERIAEFPP